MQCHSSCAACCIAPMISSALPNMPKGKPAGVRCANLGEDLKCQVYDIRPKVCRDFNAAPYSCGANHEEAVRLIGAMEEATKN